MVARRPFRRTLTADVVANLIRNAWSYAIIFCGHFPDPTYTFTQAETETSHAAAGMCASCSVPPTSTADRCST